MTCSRLTWLVLCLMVAPMVQSVQTGWRPIPGPGPSLEPGPTLGSLPSPIIPRTLFHSHLPRPHPACTLYKAVFDQDTFQQYVQYKTQIPDLKEFTLCMWHKFYNHSQDQPLFSYAHRDKSREIYSWVANSESASFYMLAINGQTLYRLNYPVRLHKWYHMCQSWNGKTGEWQIWVNSERIGRGFHNLLVGKPIKGGGMAISGQEQLRYSGGGGGKGSVPGLLGEVTLVQLYKAALTAGKAYTNHKHHHVHHFHHEDKPGEDDYAISSPSTPAPPPTLRGTDFPFLSNGQLIPMLPIPELSAFRGQSDPTVTGLFTPYTGQVDLLLPGMQRLFKRDQTKLASTLGKRIKKSEESSIAEDQMGDILKVETRESRKVKRETTKVDERKVKPINEDDILKETDDKKDVEVKKRQTMEEDGSNEDKHHKKRTLFDDQFQFGLIPGDDLSGLFPGDGYILGGGGIKFDGEETNSADPEPTQGGVQMEPAEWEVRSIMAVCSGCSEDPFRKASLISWRETSKKLYAGAMYVPAIPECQRF
ncbi:uncharacterized protein LOC124359951 isoform X1 [Homalodisca vitripennis]|uniref:uncharacterized protein LOC124359951 isoform X1 n=2 Tax=Homalodisca vitripennis TaxID=197043 RepID=UPI001EEBE844|nr:uncharacterized protein LOC124359951 isoform X1 [Homalodisca vitripennis]